MRDLNQLPAAEAEQIDISPRIGTVIGWAADGVSIGAYDAGDQAVQARRFLAEQLAVPEVVDLGPVTTRTDIASSIGPFLQAPDYTTQYPEVVTGAISELYAEYNQAFTPLVADNAEWDTDYQYTRSGPGSTAVNRWVQIDMVGLPTGFLAHADELDQAVVRETLRGSIFEIENSLANYQLLQRIHARDGQDTAFNRHFRESLDEVRRTYGKKIALLAVTDEKYDAIKATEFGVAAEAPLSDEAVMRLSGFDRFFSPAAFRQHMEETGGDSEYLLYVRSSDPVDKLRKPDTVVDTTLLEDDFMRRVIKANALTLNIDRPDLPLGDGAKINDTKAYMIPMGMAYRADAPEDVYSVEQSGVSVITLNSEFQDYLLGQGVDPEAVHSGQLQFHAKPMQAAYGCYGHVSVRTHKRNDRRKLQAGMRERGPYVVQPTIPTPTIRDANGGDSYLFIDRNFFRTDGSAYQFMGGFRSLMPIESTEAQKGRVHGNKASVWAEIT
jgi:hypothetical protein